MRQRSNKIHLGSASLSQVSSRCGVLVWEDGRRETRQQEKGQTSARLVNDHLARAPDVLVRHQRMIVEKDSKPKDLVRP